MPGVAITDYRGVALPPPLAVTQLERNTACADVSLAAKIGRLSQVGFRGRWVDTRLDCAAACRWSGRQCCTLWRHGIT